MLRDAVPSLIDWEEPSVSEDEHAPVRDGGDAAVDLVAVLRRAGLAVRGSAATLELPLHRVTRDSRDVSSGDVFVAVRGQLDGADHAADAVARGAAVVVAASPDRELGVPWLEVDDDRGALAELAAAASGHPSQRLAVVGVTGTNGKTTTVELLDAILRAAGRACGVVGTRGARWSGGPEEGLPPGRTTPEAPDLQRLLRRMADDGCGAAAIEISSHALDLQRVRGTRFAAVGFTNLTQDHLDWHRTIEAYFASKRRLFEEIAPTAPAALGADCPRCGELERGLREADPHRRVVTAGFAQGATVRIECFESDLEGARFRLVGLGLDHDVRMPRPGRHDAANAALAAALARMLEVPSDAIVAGLRRAPVVAGRLERVPSGAGEPTVFVDYAHAPGALDAVLAALREAADGRGRLVCVFGCGGDRDKEKRPLMGEVVGRRADVAVLTSDNPRSEDPEQIVREVLAGLEGAAAEVHVEVDRRRAIRRALELAGPDDVVVVAGKGHEREQEIAGRKLPFDDREVVAEELAARRGGQG